MIQFGETTFSDEVFDKILEAVKNIDPVFAFELEGAIAVIDD